MKSGLWFCLALLFSGCMPDSSPAESWDGTYIGYFHRNRQDTIPVTLTFDGRYFAAEPRTQSGHAQFSGVFRQSSSSLIFFDPNADSTAVIQGTFQYQQSQDGSLRIWQEDNQNLTELILRQL